MTVGEKIKRLRVLRGLTQEKLGKKIGISGVQVRHYELGYRKPKIETISLFAEALQVSPLPLIDIEIKSPQDIVALLWQLEMQLGIKFVGQKGEDGALQEKTISIAFENGDMNALLKRMADKQQKDGKIDIDFYMDVTMDEI